MANCLFVYAKAIIESHEKGLKLITPTWLNFSLGTYLRGQKDKRHYFGLFNSKDEIRGIKKAFILLFERKNIIVKEGIEDFFSPLLGYSKLINEYFLNHISPSILSRVDSYDFNNCIAVHVRLGDFPEKRRTPISWYKDKIISEMGKRTFLLFSDGSDEELSELLVLPNVRRVFFGNALADIIAMSRCTFIIGSDSSFSAWASFLGQVPCLFNRLQFGTILEDKSNQRIEFTQL